MVSQKRFESSKRTRSRLRYRLNIPSLDDNQATHGLSFRNQDGALPGTRFDSVKFSDQSKKIGQSIHTERARNILKKKMLG
ncbi:hypothetical protein A7K93_04280 [Candidatus Methylacidiphilum fumarolicum]|uniref:Uncharacterized protein n=2 Tax=Candidatus Methylacidiphilum fumarolicum TaxID=591154 RepID=I0JZ41_METFB|nr:hypothetical protein A7K73_02535 [Candidatus Methylacidiphilum fumarolicum]CCG92510.1 hypothetical protein MFUM_700060 [Methylacidiphilum fumariolicum SolV]TFE74237.1 hypothetical protein A7K93_04280 [Candidatus Methylacidiphilum fumarolicum]TFE75736.1 hypothetical protein A7K72_00960 [Candidatus Methylacidiphilum fumarolicum]TFE75895.1 hypothetical protein A7D33_01170 [Candidatus Methylacidiphilum fumarolicum]